MYTKIKALMNPRRVAIYILCHYLAPLLPDGVYLKVLFWLSMGYWPNIDNPQTFNEKLQWLKLYNRKPEYTQMVDKAAVKKYVSDIIGEEYIIPTIGVWDSVEDIDFANLPNQFVLKTTNGGGNTGVVICKDKSTFDIKSAKRKLKKSLQISIYRRFREWPYKDVNSRIMAEEYMVDESGYELKDYKWLCFDGEPKALFVATDRAVHGEETKFDFFDTEFNHLTLTNGHPNSHKPIAKPLGFERMKVLAAKLSAGHPHLRVDFYDINGKIYFGELTFFHFSGMVPFEPKEWDYKLGALIKLPM